MIRNIIFDMGGVIIPLDTENAFRRFQEMGVDTDKCLGYYGQQGFYLDFEAGRISPEEFCRRLAKSLGRESVSLEEARYCWMGYIKEVPVSRLHNLLELKKKYHLGLLSNTNPFIMDFVRSEDFSADRKPISHYFHSLFISCEMGVCKPDAEIFLKALAADNMKPEETIFVDDSLQNIQAASKLGIHSLHVNTNEEWYDKLIAMLDSYEKA